MSQTIVTWSLRSKVTLPPVDLLTFTTMVVIGHKFDAFILAGAAIAVAAIQEKIANRSSIF